MLVRDFLAKNLTIILQALCNFFLFLRLKLPVQGRCFGSIEAIKFAKGNYFEGGQIDITE
ncbi:hypothetical protein WH47_06076 [Habropoda laboriosa]|uniref:Uncharacterized protein n=1 Tax=Habropoda laboriosa TaxID=597456 RepID=A0A0L7QSJ7_9HYME|nr:hypothetical protein WH47_06076 [Habropoda laboriosa]